MALRNSEIIRKIDISEFDEVYQLFEDSFIPSELRPYKLMKELFNHEFVIYAYKKDNEILSALIVWEFNECVFIENFATLKTMRNLGLGSKMLTYIKNIYKDYLIVLEVEEPVHNEEIRRVHFYKKNGFYFNDYCYVQPVLRTGYPGVMLYLMSYPSHIDTMEYENIKNILFNQVYKVNAKK